MARLVASVALVALVLTGCGGDGPGTTPTHGADIGSLTRSGAGHSFFEIYEPSGSVRGTMLMIHGGGWTDRPGQARRINAGQAAVYRQQHWRVVNIGYRAPQRSAGPDPMPMLRDVVAFYDQIHRAFPGPVCATGGSSGGNLVAMLAVERPSLTCAVIAAAPLDLPGVLAHSSRVGRAAVIDGIGTDPKTLRFFSPTLRWAAAAPRTQVFLTAADNDPLIPLSQAKAFAAVAPRATLVVLPGSSTVGLRTAPFVHSDVRRTALLRAFAQQAQFLDRVVPVRAVPRPAVRHPLEACDSAVAPADWRRDARTDRWTLLLAGESWRQLSTPGQALVATAGCSGSAGQQDAGLSLWAIPVVGRVPPGTQAAQVLTAPSGTTLHEVHASLRGFLARPRDWAIGLYAYGRTTARATPVAACRSSRCQGLRLVRARGGYLVAGPADGRHPDRVDEPPVNRFRLPAGTKQVAWQLVCVAPAGCPLTGPVRGARRRDPGDHPAILSVYRVRAV